MTYGINHATSVSSSSCFDRNSSFNINGVRIAVNKGNSLQNIISRINSVSSRTGVSAKLTRSGEITLISKNNKPIKIQDKFGVLFGLGSKNSKGVSTIPKLSDDLIDISAKNNNVIYLKNNSSKQQNNIKQEHVIEKINKLKNGTQQEQKKLTDYWLSICMRLDLYFLKNINPYVKDYNQFIENVQNQVNIENPVYVNSEKIKAESLKTMLSLYKKCYSADEIDKLNIRFLA